MPLPLTQEQIDQMTPEVRKQHLDAINAEIQRRQGGGMTGQPTTTIGQLSRGNISGGAKSFGMGLLQGLPYVLANRMPPTGIDTATRQAQLDEMRARANYFNARTNPVNNNPTVPLLTQDVNGKVTDAQGNPVTAVPKNAKILKTGQKPGVLSQLGIDTQNKSIEEVRAEVQQKNPALYTYLEKVGNNQLPVRGSFGMSYNQVTEIVSSLFPGYDPLKYMSKEHATKNIGLQDAKVNQAIHLRSLADQYYDQESGNYNIPYAQYAEMVMGLANLVSNSNQTTDSQRKEINQRTATGDINGLATYLTGTPKNASTQQMMKNLIDSIDRQGKVSEQERNSYSGQGSFGNSFTDYIQNSPSNKKVNQTSVTNERDQAKQILLKKGYSEQEAEQMLGQ